MKTRRIFGAVALLALLLAAATGAALADDRLVSGAPYDGYFRGVRVEANGPVVRDEVAIEGPSRLVTVEGWAVRMGNQNAVELAEVVPEAFIGIPVDLEQVPTAFAEAEATREAN